jgi:hypothetical protein
VSLDASGELPTLAGSGRLYAVKGVDRKRCICTIGGAAPLIAWAMLSPACARECPPETTKVLDQCLGPASPRDVPDQSSQGGGSGTGANDAGDASDASHVSDAGHSSAVSDAPLVDGADSDGTEGDAPIDCGAGSIRAGSECIPANLFVSTEGHDGNPGTSELPFLTFRKAMRFARPGQTVNFEPGTYGTEETGDDFNDPIPDQVNLQRRGTDGEVVFRADGSGALVFNGSGALTNVKLARFENPIKATTGAQVVTSVTIAESTGAVLLTGDAGTTFREVSIAGAPVVLPNTRAFRDADAVTVRPYPASVLIEGDRVRLDWIGGSLEGTYARCDAGNGIVVLGSSLLRIADFTLKGRWHDGIHLVGDGTLDVLYVSRFDPECGFSLWAGGVTGELKVQLAAEFGTTVAIGDNQALRVRYSQFYGEVGLMLGGTRNRRTDDLGTPTDPGGNSFTDRKDGLQRPKQHTGLMVHLGAFAEEPKAESVIEASGNTWAPNVQGADQTGRYWDAGAVWGPTIVAGTERVNFTLGGKIQLKL